MVALRSGVAPLHYRAGRLALQSPSRLTLETNVPILPLTARQVILATVAAVLALSTSACATKPPPAPVEPTPLVKKG